MALGTLQECLPASQFAVEGIKNPVGCDSWADQGLFWTLPRRPVERMKPNPHKMPDVIDACLLIIV